MGIKIHKHRAIPEKSQTRGFGGPVSHPGNPAAHGNICVIDYCRCGATRATNINGRHVERGQWQDDDE